jgi:nucleoredoxin
MLVCALIVSVAAALCANAKPAPMTTKEVSLMLRSGYSVAAVQSELAKRHFIDSLDAASEKVLLGAGATPALITALRSGSYAVPASEIAAATAEMEAQANRKAAQAEEGRKLNSLYQEQLAQQRGIGAPAGAGANGNKIAGLVKGNLVSAAGGAVAAASDEAFEKKKLIGLYFSASWCGPCRKFTPELVEYYKRVAAARPEFEILFVSSDRSATAMEQYMRDFNMPWPAVKFEKAAENAELKAYGGKGIPCLVVVDASGKVIADSYVGETYVGPSKVLRDLDQHFAGGRAAAPIAQR